MDKNNSHKNLLYQKSKDPIIFNQLPLVFWVGLIYLGALVLQNTQEPILIPSLFFGFAIAIQAFLYLISYKFRTNNRWLYLIVQGFILFFSAFILPKGSPVVLIGLLPVLIAQSIVILNSYVKVTVFFILSYALYCIAISVNYGASELPIFISIFFLILVIVIFYTVIYNKQVNARLRMEFYLQQLELAYKKVEELTLTNERQRMARDLHDTLAQGLAGLIMQLEAINVHVKNGNLSRSNEIIVNSMNQARETLKDARVAIDDLRTDTLENTDFHSAISNELTKFEELTGLSIEKKIKPVGYLSNLTKEFGIYIVRESLTNIAKHGKASEVKVELKPLNGELFMGISDNGIGFDYKKIRKQQGKYGLVGLQERVRLIGGSIKIDSTPGEGTHILIMVPF
ncbi:sensor histidine kinase [Oceanobacillus sojae]|uniref:sensor histidine kinase n=1 Tax=Oceanobacillus sojae TaxID=582851 RepID=UPI003635DAF8